MIAVKGNIEYTINESEKKFYVERGFDIYQDGKKIADGQHKTVPFDQFKKLKADYEQLKASAISETEITELKTDIQTKETEIAKLRADIQAEKDKATEKLQKELEKLKK